jgi:hypothetical protein
MTGDGDTVIRPRLVDTLHVHVDEAAFWRESQGDTALERLVAPVYSVKAGPLLVDIEALG